MSTARAVPAGVLGVSTAWTACSWGRSGRPLASVRRAWRDGNPTQALAIAAGVGANLANDAWLVRRALRAAPLRGGGMRWIALAVAAGGLACAQASRRALGDAWTPFVELEGEAIRSDGPYAVVRHPLYAGAIAMYGGLLVAQSDPAAVAVFGTHAVGFLAKTIHEDRVLLDGTDAYRRYARAVRWRLVPGVW